DGVEADYRQWLGLNKGAKDDQQAEHGVAAQFPSRSDRQLDIACTRTSHIDRVPGFDPPRPLAGRFTGVRIRFEFRVVAARYVQPDAVALDEQVADRSEIDADLVRLAGNQQLRFCMLVAIPRPYLAVGDVQS